jgi:pimeloyl-ACP methyl ester carboxylesterase
MDSPAICRLDWEGCPVDIEYHWLDASTSHRPLMVFLHEGLGSVSMWRDYPAQLCHALDWNGLVYSRPGYGRSTPRAANHRWEPDFMHRQALGLLPALLVALGLPRSNAGLWLFGHSDGGSIALIHAAHHPAAVQGLVVVAPHVMVEDLSINSIQRAREAYLRTDLRARLSRHHQDPDSAFWGWNDVWLSPAFRRWSIEDLLPQVVCPVLAVQGSADEYGTLAQIERIAQRSPQATPWVIPDCGHSPHREQPEALTRATVAFAAGLSPSALL